MTSSQLCVLWWNKSTGHILHHWNQSKTTTKNVHAYFQIQKNNSWFKMHHRCNGSPTLRIIWSQVMSVLHRKMSLAFKKANLTADMPEISHPQVLCPPPHSIWTSRWFLWVLQIMKSDYKKKNEKIVKSQYKKSCILIYIQTFIWC